MPQALSISQVPLDTLTLVEASAGTGKTYAIAGLYLRLVLETDIRVPQILVVTYTRAATEELRERIRQRLVDAQQMLRKRIAATDPDLQALLARVQEADAKRARRRLEAALLAFDEAAIYTIHSFCQRVLTDTAFASAMPLSTEMVAAESALVLQIVEDFWRRQLYAARPRLARQVLERWSPVSLCQTLQPLLGKPYLHLAVPAAVEDMDTLESAFVAAFSAAQGTWQQGAESVLELLNGNPALNGNKYRPSSVVSWGEALHEWFASEDPDPKPPERFYRFTTSGLVEGVKKGKTPPEHPFFAQAEVLLHAANTLQQAYTGYLSHFVYQLLQICEVELPRLKRQHKVQAYDDLLLNLHWALHDAQRGEGLASQLRERYRAALIDEFQDTDPTQYAIFQRLYADSRQPVFLVGDPKQAIYSFRGADIFAYLYARQAVGAEYTLDTNRRSGEALVQALNTLFQHRRQPFLLSQIHFQPVRAVTGRQSTLTLPETDGAPLQFWFQGPQDDHKPHPRGVMTRLAVAAVAGRITTLLNQAARGEALLNGKPLLGSHMAVLVRTNRQAMLVREALLTRGVASVLHSPDSVFDSHEAQELERLLAALLQPRREDLVRAALLSDCLGFSLEELERLGQDDQAWEALLGRFADYHQRWREQGFMRMFRQLLINEGVYARLLGRTEGERRLTNLLHLGELAQAASVDQRLGQEALLQWLLAQRQQPTVSDEERQLRLESDAELVQIVTIHKSKGLEYPMVFCPFLWDGHLWNEKADILRCHDPQDQYQAVLDLGSDDLERRRVAAIKEELAEQLRLAYVALTRARERCYVVCGAVKDLDKSALGWLLHPPPTVAPSDDPLEAQKRFIKSLDETGLRRGLNTLLQQAAGAISVQDLPQETGHYQPVATPQPPLQARVFRGIPPLGWRFSSFSSLQSRHGSGLADYDSGTEGVGEVVDSATIHGFPRGTRAGRCLHAILERLRFDTPLEAQQPLIEQQLNRHGFELAWQEVISATLQRVLTTPLGAEAPWHLASVAAEERLNELEFTYRMDRLGAEDLHGLVADHGMDPMGLAFSPQQGFMRGVIDVLCRVGGRFHLLDYKSNWLGNCAEDYHPEALSRAMVAGGYHLQYLIYTVAAHRYLRWRVPDYDYERDFAGVYYLFLRGMDGRSQNAGVFQCRPPAGLIADLDAYLILEPQ